MRPEVHLLLVVSLVVTFSMAAENILVWNIRGLNANACRDALRELVVAERPSIVCLQETKVAIISNSDVLQFIGHGFDYFYRPTDGTRGGIHMAWQPSTWVVSNTSMHTYSISPRLRHNSGGEYWWLTLVYGPSDDVDKPNFLTELHELRLVCSGPWLLCGNFNMIYKAEDKNNNRLDRRLMGRFRRFLNDTTLKEVHLTGRLYTWSNKREHPTLSRIDRVFVSNEWEELFPVIDLHSLSSLYSDHMPLLL
jgi:exonuclease III